MTLYKCFINRFSGIFRSETVDLVVAGVFMILVASIFEGFLLGILSFSVLFIFILFTIAACINDSGNIVSVDELYNSESYKKIAQEKIDVVTDINKIKYDKKLMVEKNKLYNEDIKLFELFTKEKEKNKNFVIPALFELKFPIFDRLIKENNLSFETFMEEYEKVKPENNYDMFTSNNYEKTFEKNNKDFEMEFELQI